MMAIIAFSCSAAKVGHWRKSPPAQVDTFVNKLRVLILLGITLAFVMTAGFLAAKPNPPGTNGAYKIVFAGAYEGRGNAAVGAKSVTITGQVTDATTGAKGNFIASNLSLDGGRFSGSGKVMGFTLQVSGRVEAADGGLVSVPRIMCNFCTSAGGNGRIVGQKKKGP